MFIRKKMTSKRQHPPALWQCVGTRREGLGVGRGRAPEAARGERAGDRE